MNPRLLVCAAIAALGLAAPASAQQRAPGALDAAKAAAVDAAVNAEIERQKLVGVAIGVIQNGKIAYVKGYGLADAEKKAPVTADTVFNWASNSKPVMAVLAMQLVEKGLLDLDADVRKYVPEFPESSATITCRRILCHQSGIPHYSNGKVLPNPLKHDGADPRANPVFAIDVFSRSPLLFAPGAKTSYSTYAFILLSAAVQAAGGKPIAAQLEERIVKPLGLASFEPDGKTAKPEWSAGYVQRVGRTMRASEDAHYWKHGGGAYKSNVRDFARWTAALMNRELMSEKTETAMWTTQPLSDGKATTWGLGVSVDS
ncbi:MAG TPA: serine hydrolase domain-containing protein, partial [Planctomycetia bacterium]|nr:serine hydrolase domain-containing protein [Planctomycetia bacterium]